MKKNCNTCRDTDNHGEDANCNVGTFYEDCWRPTEPAPNKNPGGNPKATIGSTKPPMSSVPPVALIHLGQAMKDGRIKYGPMNWRETEVSSSVYYDAMLRHILAWWDGQDRAEDSDCHHLAHAMACCAILLDAMASGSLHDDRPPKGNVAGLIKSLTTHKKAA